MKEGTCVDKKIDMTIVSEAEAQAEEIHETQTRWWCETMVELQGGAMVFGLWEKRQQSTLSNVYEK